jgi:hypothetical protein
LSDGSRLLREIYGVVLRYRQVPATRFDAVENNDVWRQACTDFGEPNIEILLGQKRSAFSPQINEASVNLLRLRHKVL